VREGSAMLIEFDYEGRLTPSLPMIEPLQDSYFAWLMKVPHAQARLHGGAQGPGLMVAVALFFSVPTLTQSSLANMGYWVDWANLLAIALGLGALAAVFSVPLLGLAGGRK
jgi:hypothetical protein